MVGLSLTASLGAMRFWLVLGGAGAGLYLPSGVATITHSVNDAHWGKALAFHRASAQPRLSSRRPLLAEALFSTLSWRGVLVVVGSVAILLGGWFALSGHGGSQRGEAPRLQTMAGLLRDRSVWAMMLIFAAGVGSSLGVYSLLPLFLVSDVGMTLRAANSITEPLARCVSGGRLPVGLAHRSDGPSARPRRGLDDHGIAQPLSGTVPGAGPDPHLCLSAGRRGGDVFPAGFCCRLAPFPGPDAESGDCPHHRRRRVPRGRWGSRPYRLPGRGCFVLDRLHRGRSPGDSLATALACRDSRSGARGTRRPAAEPTGCKPSTALAQLARRCDVRAKYASHRASLAALYLELFRLA